MYAESKEIKQKHLKNTKKEKQFQFPYIPCGAKATIFFCALILPIGKANLQAHTVYTPAMEKFLIWPVAAH